MEKFDYHARLVVYGLPEMKSPTVKRLAKWLRSLADDVEKEPKAYDKKLVARLMKTK